MPSETTLTTVDGERQWKRTDTSSNKYLFIPSNSIGYNTAIEFHLNAIGDNGRSFMDFIDANNNRVGNFLALYRVGFMNEFNCQVKITDSQIILKNLDNNMVWSQDISSEPIKVRFAMMQGVSQTNFKDFRIYPI